MQLSHYLIMALFPYGYIHLLARVCQVYEFTNPVFLCLLIQNLIWNLEFLLDLFFKIFNLIYLGCGAILWCSLHV